MKSLFFLLALFAFSAFGKVYEFEYSDYTIGFYDKGLDRYANGSEKKTPETGTLSVEMGGDSTGVELNVQFFNQTYVLEITDAKETVNNKKDSIGIFMAQDSDHFTYALVLGPTYVNFVKENFWKISFSTLENSNQDSTEKKEKKSKGNFSTGSSFAINNHILITNNHVIEGKKTIVVSNKPDLKKSFFEAEVLYTDPNLDLAVLHTDSNLTSCALDQKMYDIGEDVYVYGYPQIRKQGRSLKLTKGVISSKRGYKDDVKTYQIDAAVQHGNSGGPLVRKGKVIGVVSSMLKNSQNVNYAIKSNFLAAVLDVLDIKATGKADPKNCTYMVIGGKK